MYDQEISAVPAKKVKSPFLDRVQKDFSAYRYVYIMLIPVVAYYIIFYYVPMYGAIIAFKEFNPHKGILGSPWVGFQNFVSFFHSYYFVRVLRNTVVISLYLLVFGFPAPILLALLLNEVRNKAFKSVIQSTTYLPHFISVVVVCGMLMDFTATGGIITNIVHAFGGPNKSLLMIPDMFRSIYVTSDIWQQLGWGSIIYLASLTSIDAQQYEAATIDGAGRFKQMLHITIPGIMPTVVIMLIMRMGQIMNIGFEKIILLYNPSTYVTGDVISSFVYREGLINFNFSYSTAVGLFNSVINCAFLLIANTISRKVNETSLW